MKINLLTNHFLVAMPKIQDDFFSKAVIYIYEHSDQGALGLIINKPFQTTLGKLYQHLGIKVRDLNILDQPVLVGGPVGERQGFVVHNMESDSNEIILSSARDTLERIAVNQGPSRFLVVLGYAGWVPGQIEEEIQRNDWLITPLDNRIMFKTPIEKRWETAIGLLGIHAYQLCEQVGHA